MNTLKTFGLLTLLTGLFVILGQLVGGTQGAVIAFLFAAVMNLGAYWFSHKLVLARYRAQEVPPGGNQRIDRIVDNLCSRARLPRPKIYIIPESQPNAFATGRNPENGVVAVTQGLLQSMDDDELEGVIAHELAHIQNRDILTGTIAATIAGAVMMVASFARWGALFGGFGGDRRDGNPLGLIAMLLAMFLAPVAATMIQMGISRQREFAADRDAAEMSGNPQGLASALRKLGVLSGRVPMQRASEATAHMFIVNPFRAGMLAKLFSTHPPLEDRIRRLIGDRG